MSFAGGVLSVLCAAFFALKARTAWLPLLVSYAIGALLGAVFLEILPHAVELSQNVEQMTATILFGILFFFVMEKLVLWRHCHQDACEAHGSDNPQHDMGRSGMMIMIGNTFHNFVDGILIAAAFLADVRLGIITSLAIITHEIPQEVGDFLVLLHSGYDRRQALAFNLLSSTATLLGGVLAYFTLHTMQQIVPPVLGLAIASMLYVAVADLIPGLHKRPELHVTMQQVLLISLGIGSIWLAQSISGSLV
ncbi:MAG TPA: ZIP family metal transporter [Burkholderiales bacterium]|nr:ZIP family metal transporter [Burkholderiales bacterium]